MRRSFLFHPINRALVTGFGNKILSFLPPSFLHHGFELTGCQLPILRGVAHFPARDIKNLFRFAIRIVATRREIFFQECIVGLPHHFTRLAGVAVRASSAAIAFPATTTRSTSHIFITSPGMLLPPAWPSWFPPMCTPLRLWCSAQAPGPWCRSSHPEL